MNERKEYILKYIEESLDKINKGLLIDFDVQITGSKVTERYTFRFDFQREQKG